jgi:hypothetical protein
MGSEVQIALANVLAGAGHFASARQVAAKITDVRKRANVLAALVGMLGGAGLTDQAEQTAHDAEQAAAEVGDDYWLVSLVPILAEAGLVNRAVARVAPWLGAHFSLCAWCAELDLRDTSQRG